MTTKQQQPLPAATRQRLQQWIDQRQQLTDLINATLSATKEALDVPPHWVIQDIGEGFIDPATLQAGEATEQPAE